MTARVPMMLKSRASLTCFRASSLPGRAKDLSAPLYGNTRCHNPLELEGSYRRADKSLARQGRKQARKYVRDARDFNNIATQAVINFFFLQGKAPKEIHAILTETLVCFLPGRAKDLSAPRYCSPYVFR